MKDETPTTFFDEVYAAFVKTCNSSKEFELAPWAWRMAWSALQFREMDFQNRLWEEEYLMWETIWWQDGIESCLSSVMTQSEKQYLDKVEFVYQPVLLSEEMASISIGEWDQNQFSTKRVTRYTWIPELGSAIGAALALKRRELQKDGSLKPYLLKVSRNDRKLWAAFEHPGNVGGRWEVLVEPAGWKSVSVIPVDNELFLEARDRMDLKSPDS